MLERRARASTSLGFNHVQRRLKTGEQVPAIPGLTEQLLACRKEAARRRSVSSEELDELALMTGSAGDALTEDEDEDDF